MGFTTNFAGKPWKSIRDRRAEYVDPTVSDSAVGGSIWTAPEDCAIKSWISAGSETNLTTPFTAVLLRSPSSLSSMGMDFSNGGSISIVEDREIKMYLQSSNSSTADVSFPVAYRYAAVLIILGDSGSYYSVMVDAVPSEAEVSGVTRTVSGDTVTYESLPAYGLSFDTTIQYVHKI